MKRFGMSIAIGASGALIWWLGDRVLGWQPTDYYSGVFFAAVTGAWIGIGAAREFKL